ncbi:MAG: response regulator [Elusimicrobia bacterium]|nr:response regulator [Elusimicrobiota bacterium]
MPTILLADDDGDLRALLARVLRSRGWTVRESPDGTQALRAALESPPDLAALDESMPGLCGCGVCRELRADPRTRGIAVLLMTGAPNEELQRLDPPPDAWLAKPFRLAEFTEKAAELLAASAARASARTDSRNRFPPPRRD